MTTIPQSSRSLQKSDLDWNEFELTESKKIELDWIESEWIGLSEFRPVLVRTVRLYTAIFQNRNRILPIIQRSFEDQPPF